MIDQFKSDFWSLARESKGYYSWAQSQRWKLYRAMRRRIGNCRMCDEPIEGHTLVQSLFEEGLGLHPLLDIAFEAYARAESRLCLRFIPQRSNEERLTGHLISEIDAAIYLAAPTFSNASLTRYGKVHPLDFAYNDLSRGGRMEKISGGDFGLIISVDLPDQPKITQFAAFQAKKITASPQLEKYQYDTLVSNFGSAANYIFYDVDFARLSPPIVVAASELESKRMADDKTNSFSVDSDFIFSHGLPLSLWLSTQLSLAKSGSKASTFSDAYRTMVNLANQSSISKSRRDFEGEQSFALSRLAVVSIGRSLQLEFDNDNQQSISLV